MTSLYLLGRKTWAVFQGVSDSQQNSGTNSGCDPLSPENGIFTITFHIVDRDSLVPCNPFELLYEIHCVSERNTRYRWWVYLCMCAVNSALDIGRIWQREEHVPWDNYGGQTRRVTSCVKEWVRLAMLRPLNSCHRKTNTCESNVMYNYLNS